jgi:hypothetical protein
VPGAQLGPDRHQGQELAEIHADELAAGQALEVIAQAKWRRGYQDL